MYFAVEIWLPRRPSGSKNPARTRQFLVLVPGLCTGGRQDSGLQQRNEHTRAGQGSGLQQVLAWRPRDLCSDCGSSWRLGPAWQQVGGAAARHAGLTTAGTGPSTLANTTLQHGVSCDWLLLAAPAVLAPSLMEEAWIANPPLGAPPLPCMPAAVSRQSWRRRVCCLNWLAGSPGGQSLM